MNLASINFNALMSIKSHIELMFWNQAFLKPSLSNHIFVITTTRKYTVFKKVRKSEYLSLESILQLQNKKKSEHTQFKMFYAASNMI